MVSVETVDAADTFDRNRTQVIPVFFAGLVACLLLFSGYLLQSLFS